jgi:hypothetical protein
MTMHVRAAAVLGVVMASGSAMALPEFETLALRGTQAPGLPAGVQWGVSAGGLLTDDSFPVHSGGAFVVAAPLIGAGVTVLNDTAAYIDRGNGLELLMREGQDPVGLPTTYDWGQLRRVNITGEQKAVFIAGLTGGTSISEGLWFGTPGALTLAAAKGMAAPGPGGPIFLDLDEGSLVAGPDGWYGLAATITSTQPGLYVGNASGLQMLVRKGEPVPGVPGATFSTFTDPATVTNVVQLAGGGRGLFYANISGGGSTFLNDGGIWMGTPGNLQFVAREGDPAPGFATGTLASFVAMTANVNGQVAFRTSLNGLLTSMNVVYRGTPGNLSQVIKKGDAAPGILGAQFNDVLATSKYRLWLNQNGDMLVGGTIITGGVITGDNNEAIWYFPATGEPQLIAHEGDEFTEVGEGATFSGAEGLVQQFSLDANGRVTALVGVWQGSLATNRAVFTWTPSGGRTLILRKGDFVTLDDGSSGTVTNITGLIQGGTSDGYNGSTRPSDGAVGLIITLLNDQGSSVRSVWVNATTTPTCDSIDFNGDGVFPDNQDIIDFFFVFGGGDCPSGTCNDLDFNNDGVFPDNGDLIRYLEVFGGSAC